MGERLSDEVLRQVKRGSCCDQSALDVLVAELDHARESEKRLAKLLHQHVRWFRGGFVPINDRAFIGECEQALSAAGVKT